MSFIIAVKMKKLLAVVFVLVSLFFSETKPVSAQTATPSPTVAPGVCVQVYGGGVVCGAQAPEHKPVPAGISDNIVIFGSLFLLTSFGLFMLSRRKLNRSVERSDFKGGDN